MTSDGLRNAMAYFYSSGQATFAQLSAERQNWINTTYAEKIAQLDAGTYNPAYPPQSTPPGSWPV